MGVERLVLCPSGDARARTIRQDVIALLIINQICDHDLAKDLFMDGWIKHRQQRLDAPVEITRHEVGGRKIDMRLWVRQIMAAAKAIDSGMFEKAADNGLHPYVFRQPL